MYAAVRRYEGIKDDDEAARLVRDSFMPQLEKVSGFIAYYWIDAGEGVMASLSVFQDKAGADESVKFAHKWIEENAPGLFPQPPRVTEGTVVCHDNECREPDWLATCDHIAAPVARLRVPGPRRASVTCLPFRLSEGSATALDAVAVRARRPIRVQRTTGVAVRRSPEQPVTLSV